MSRVTANGNGQVLTREIGADISLRALHAAHPRRYPFLLQSTASVSSLCRYDILFAYPGDALVLDQLINLAGPGADLSGDFLAGLDRWWRENRTNAPDGDLPFHGGWFLYLGYELAAQIEPRLSLTPDPVLPTAFAVRCPAAFVQDRQQERSFIVCEADAEWHVESMRRDAAASSTGDGEGNGARDIEMTATEDPGEFFLSAVRRAKEYVADGDIYQANLSRSWHADVGDKLTASEVYERLCRANPAPFAASVHWNETDILSSSPERLISVRDNVVSTRPIAGTRPRGENCSSDSALSEELFGHPKERAEHVMLIDLERNDLGRVCEPGSVEVDEFMALESYAHVHHIVSNVSGTLQKSVSPGEAIRAVFPGGTITGCPKVRCMEIIGELEQSPRGAYTGSLGYLNRDGSLDLNILIRTMVMSDTGIELKAGSGIVADSDPQAELDETRAKAKGLLMAFS